jgi:hypothetical protein
MFNSDMLPLNLKILVLNEDNIRYLKQITDLSIFQPSSKNFSEKGLFSVDIFGPAGSEMRNRTYAYIKLKTSVLHPLLFRTIVKLKGKYNDIMSGKLNAIWNNDIKDFIESEADNSETGYYFFLSHFKDLTFKQTGSPQRKFYTDMIEKYKDKQAMMEYLVVMPAGLRDYEIDPDGKPSKDEINSLYNKVLILTNLIPDNVSTHNPESINNTRYKLQLAILEIYEYIEAMLDGKHKFIQSKWVSRNTFVSTRNVITTINNDVPELYSDLTISVNDTAVGLFQYAKATQPITTFNLKQFLSKAFPDPNSPANLINKKTLKKESVHIESKTYDKWLTDEGLEKVINDFGIEDFRHMEITIEDHYLALLYTDKNNYLVTTNPETLPEKYSIDNFKPITYAELFYIVMYPDSQKYPCLVTRYPVSGIGGIYPSYVYLKSTYKSNRLAELDEYGEPTGKIAKEFPIRGAEFFDALAPSQAHLKTLNADFDGDMCSLSIVFTKEARDEINTLLSSKKFYVSVSGEMNFSANTDTIDYVLSTMTS